MAKYNIHIQLHFFTFIPIAQLKNAFRHYVYNNRSFMPPLEIHI